MNLEHHQDNRVDILLVDDQPENLLALEVALSCLGQNLIKVASGEEALKSVLRREFAVIVMDVVMPGLDGFETAEMLRSREKSKHTPIIFLTARTYDEVNVLKGYAMGAVDYIIKPFDPEILRSKVGFFVDLFNKSKQLRTQARLLRQVMERERVASAALSERARELARSNSELEQFANVTSHDLQEPLRVVSTYTQLFARKYKGNLDAEAEEFIGYIVDGAARMQAMIQDLLTFSRAGQSDESWGAVDCNEVAAIVMSNLKTAILESGATVTLQPLPLIPGQRTQFVRLFQNLVENAIKFRSERPLQVEISSERDDRMWLFSVRDNGIGIEPQYFDRIFRMFQRLHSREEFPGTGLGLAIVRKIVDHFGGRVWVESEPGRGSSFKFSFPVNGRGYRNLESGRAKPLLTPDQDSEVMDLESLD